MKVHLKLLCVFVLLGGSMLLFSFLNAHTAYKPSFSFPYKKAGLTERQAAAHLLSRFTYGAKPGQVDEVVKIGLEKWFQQQLDARQADDSLNKALEEFDALKLSNAEAAKIYAKQGQVIRMAIKDGFIDKDSVNKAEKPEYRSVIQAYMQKNGLKPEQELFRQLINQKILRAAYTNNQLQEVLTDFWFNHFNVSITKGNCAEFIPAYERDVIRPNVTAKFGDLLLATAKSPAMLYFLDNFSSSGASANNAGQQAKLTAQLDQMGDTAQRAVIMKKISNGKRAGGLNENYAREVMELHTLGVDGGYTQQDVTQAARVLTGWTVYPMDNYDNGVRKQIENLDEDKLAKRGFVHDGDFLFIPNRHDNGTKTVLGVSFANQGYQEGVRLLDMLAHHQSTAKFITRKLAVRFVSDAPPATLLAKMAKAFTEKDGDIKQVLITMASSPEFWGAASVREKTKSPFELAISSARSLNATIKQPYQLYNWINKMGQKIYFYQAPTGFPDKAQYWINTGALLNRMNFGLALASQRIPGVNVDLAALNNHHEPESPQAALTTYGKLVMPERNLTETIKRLTPVLNDPELSKKVDAASQNTTTSRKADTTLASGNMMAGDMMMAQNKKQNKGKGGLKKSNQINIQYAAGNNSMLAQVVGVIIGSPEYQRR
jgi:uncharacterized protein (DUF1800 family)